jgi:hypothetical protein
MSPIALAGSVSADAPEPVEPNVADEAPSQGVQFDELISPISSRDFACASVSECQYGEYCTVDDGVCDPAPGCTGASCEERCFGTCAPFTIFELAICGRTEDCAPAEVCSFLFEECEASCDPETGACSICVGICLPAP